DSPRRRRRQGVHRHPAGRGLLHAESTGPERRHAQPLAALADRAGPQRRGCPAGAGRAQPDGIPPCDGPLRAGALALEKKPRMKGSSIWMIGDVQGCCAPLDQLLNHPDIAGEDDARFWFAGDLVNRGPQSLASLRRIIELGERAVAVLGNHDLHLLAAAAGVRKPSKSDTIDDILQAPDAADLIDWLRQRPLAHFEHGHLLVHAGVLAKWDVPKTLALAAEVQELLRGPNWQK